ncbi:unnamed protein product [Calypogeia fissa]
MISSLSRASILPFCTTKTGDGHRHAFFKPRPRRARLSRRQIIRIRPRTSLPRWTMASALDRIPDGDNDVVASKRRLSSHVRPPGAPATWALAPARALADGPIAVGTGELRLRWGRYGIGSRQALRGSAGSPEAQVECQVEGNWSTCATVGMPCCSHTSGSQH